MPYAQINRAQFRQLLINRLGAAGTTFWRTDELNRIIQESLRVFNSLTGFWRARATPISTVANQVWYTLPGTITSSMRVSFGTLPMVNCGLSDLDTSRKFWESETTVTGSDVPTRPFAWGIGDLNLIAIWPADAAGANQLLVDGIASTPILANDGSNLDIGQEELNGLLDYCECMAMFKEGGAEQDVASQTLFQNFLKCAMNRSKMLASNFKFISWAGYNVTREKHPIHTKKPKVGMR